MSWSRQVIILTIVICAGVGFVACGGGDDDAQPLSAADTRTVEDAAGRIDSICPVSSSDSTTVQAIELSGAESAASDIAVVLAENPDALIEDGNDEVPLSEYAEEVENEILGCGPAAGTAASRLSEALNEAGRD